MSAAKLLRWAKDKRMILIYRVVRNEDGTGFISYDVEMLGKIANHVQVEITKQEMEDFVSGRTNFIEKRVI
jgi:hypothetical protein